MADGFESYRTEAYFNGKLKPNPIPKRIKQTRKARKNEEKRIAIIDTEGESTNNL